MNDALAHLQQAFANAVIGDAGDATGDGLLRPTPQGLSARLSIYGSAYRQRLGEALKENYPILALVLGDDAFADLAAGYLQHYPSRKPSIRWFGDALEQYIDTEPDAVPHPALHDLIRMEWALGSAFDGEDAEPLQVADFVQLPAEAWSSLRFDLHPTLRLLALSWNVEPLWAALTADPQADTDAPEAFAHHLLIWRKEHQTQWRSVEPVEAHLLNAVQNGHTFGDLCELTHDFGTADCANDAATAVAGYLRIWVEAGLLTNMTATP